MSRPMISDFPPRRRINLYQPQPRPRVNWNALVLPICFAFIFSGLAYAVNSWRVSADAAVDRWAKQVGME
jgi:hypothetical protein